MKVITVATKENGYFDTLIESAHKFNYDLIILGYNHVWKGFGWRLKLIINFLETLDYNEIIMVVDAYDVILLQDAKEALNRYKKLNVSFLCGAFRISNGLIGFIQENEFGKSKKILSAPYDSLCAGTWMTTVKTALEIYKKYEIEDNDDDQILLNKIFDIEGINTITPDTNFEIFCTVFPNIITRNIQDIDKIVITQNKTLKSNITNTEPILIHGLGNTNLNNILKELGFKNTNSLTDYKYNFKKLWYHLKLFFKIFINKLFL